ncbi:MAG: hypothetical protein OER82_04445 [Nitrosopumilus sp.]|nr:hypothetical protein [Nitrosopumilus sp.]
MDNLQQLSNFVVGKKKEIEFNIPAMKLHRNDNLKLKEKISSMTNEERKGFEINKSTLWYMKKNLKEGKTISVYDKVLSKIQTLQ